MKKNIIHALTIIDKSTSMQPHQSRTIEGINSNINALKTEVDADTQILNTQLQFSSKSNRWIGGQSQQQIEEDFVFTRLGVPVETLTDMTTKDYIPDGGTPLLDAIGYGIEKIKSFHGDQLGNDNLKIIVTVFTDGDENTSRKWTKPDIKKMIEHFQGDGKWTFTFVGCGSLEDVTTTSTTLGISAANTVAYVATDAGFDDAYGKVATSYVNFARSAKLGMVDNDLFTVKSAPAKQQ